MKPSELKDTPQYKVRTFMDAHPKEIFKTRILSEEVGMDTDLLGYHLRKLGYHSTICYDGSKVWGTKKTIGEAKKIMGEK